MKKGQEIDYNLFKSLVEQSKDATIVLSDKKKSIYISPNSSKILGLLKPAISETDLFRLIHPENIPEIKKVYSGKSKKPKDFTIRVKQKDDYRWYNLTLSKLDNNNTAFTFKGIHKKIAAEENLRESEEKYKLLFDKSPIPKWIYNKKTYVIIDANESAINHYGYTKDDFKNMTIKDIRPKEDVKKLLEFEKSRKQSKKLTNYGIWRHKKKNGEIILVEVSGHPIKYNNQDCNVAVCIDVTEREQNLQRIQESEEFSKNILSSLSSGIAVIDKKGIILSTNDVWENHSSISKKKTNTSIGVNYLKSLQKSAESGDIYSAKALKGIKKVISQKEDKFEMEYPIQLPNKNTLWFLLNVSHFKGKVSNTVIRHVNITEKKLSEKALQNAYNEKEYILESISDGFFAVNENWTITYFNKEAENLLTFPAAKVIGKNLWNIVENPDTDEIKKMKTVFSTIIKNQRPYLFEYYYKRIEKWFEIKVSPSKIGGLSIYFRDISYKKTTEQTLKKLYFELEERANSLAASNAELEQFAYVASHDLQEPLRMVTSFLGQIEEKYSNILDEKGKKYIHFAVDGAQRMRQLIIDLLEYSRLNQSNIEKSFFNVDELLNSIIQLNSIAIKQNKAKITIGKMPKVYGVQNSIQSVFQNLISNALKYQKKNIKPIIKIKSTDSPTHWKFSISDNGIGIDSRYFDRIFHIFQRLHNKEEYSGTGIGLAMCQKIITAHKGKIWLESLPGKGSTFYFTLKKPENNK